MSLLSALLLNACGGGGSSTPPEVVVTLTPATANIATGQTRTFTATVSNASDTTVTWLVNGLAGGNATVGTIDSQGVYTAPNTVPSPATVTVTAVSNADKSKSASATVTIAFGNPVGVTITPANVSVSVGNTQSFTATVSNTGNTAVVWQVNGITGGNSTIGTITSQGVYIAPTAVPSPATVTVTAVSQADPTKSAAASVTIVRSVGVTVTIAPTSASVATGATQQFTATVANTLNSTVIWEVNSNRGGNATEGTIDNNGLYTAPALVPAPATVTVTAVSQADTTRSASAKVTIIPTGAISVTIQPATATVTTGKTQQFTATVVNTPNTTVTWQVNGATGGNGTVGAISSSGLYTAPASVPSPAVVTVTAVSSADSTQSASSQVTIEAPSSVTVSVSPASANVTVGKTQQFSASVNNAPDGSVSWEVNGVAGGDTTLGTINGNGLYTAPAAVPSPAVVSVTAVSNFDPGATATAAVTIQAASSVQVSVSPSTVAVPERGRQQFKATVRGGGSGSQSVTWQVNGVTGGSASAGTIDGTGLYTAPPSIPSPGTVTINAVPAGSPNVAGSAAASIVDGSGDPPAQLTGAYVFQVEGMFYSTIGSFTADGKGNIRGQEDNGTGQIQFTGSDSVAADGSGSAVLHLADGSTQMLDFVLGAQGSGPCQRTDQVSFGTIAPQAAFSGAPDLGGTWMVVVDSSDFAGIGGLTAQLDLKPGGTLTGTVQALAYPPPSQPAFTTWTVTGSWKVGADGRGTLTLVSGSHGSSRYFFDLRDPAHLLLLGTPGTGTAARQGQDSASSTASLTGTYVVNLRDTDLNPFIDQGIEETVSGQLTFDGKGNLTAGTLDANQTGNRATAAAVAPASCAESSDGACQLTLTAPGVPPLHPGPISTEIRMASAAEGVVIGGGMMGGVAQRQLKLKAGATLDNSFVQGAWAVQLYGYNGIDRRPEAFLGTLHADGAGTLSGALESFGAWSSMQGSYTLDASGRGTMQWSDGTVTRHFAFEVVTAHELDLIGLDGRETLLGTLTPAMAGAGAMSVSPATVTLQTGQTQPFTASGFSGPVTWQVNGVAGGGAAAGTIDANGLYTAPALVPSPSTVTVTAVAGSGAGQSASAQVTITAATELTITPGTATVAAGGVLQFTASGTGVASAITTWSIESDNGSGRLGTIEGTGATATYIAPVTVPAPATVTLTASVTSSTGKPATAQSTVTITAAPAAKLTELKGPMVLSLAGSDEMLIAAFTADGQGHISDGQEQFSNPMNTGALHPYSFTGAYAVRADGWGEAMLQRSDGQEQTFYFSPLRDGTFAVQSASQAETQGRLRPLETVPNAIRGAWLLETGSPHGPAEIARIVFAPDGSLQGQDGAGAITGSWSLDGTGKGTMTLNLATGASLTDVFYPTSASHLEVIGDGTMGRADLQDSSQAPGLSGAWVFALRDRPDLIQSTLAGTLTADGHGAITGGMADGTSATGTYGGGSPITSGSYSVAGDGQLQATMQVRMAGGQSRTITMTGYLGSSMGYVQTGDGLYGMLRPVTLQAAPDDGAIKGEYLFGLQGFYGVRAADPLGLFASLTSDGAGTLTGSDGYAGDGTLSGAYSIDGGSGRGALSLTSSAHATSHFALYVIDATRVVVVGTDASGTWLGEARR